MRDDLWVVSPWPGDTQEENVGPPNNRFLRRALERSSLTFRWVEVEGMPYRTWRDVLSWWIWNRRVEGILRSRGLLPRALLSLSPFPYPAVYRLARRHDLQVWLKTYGFVYYPRGGRFRWLQGPLHWAFRHAPDGWIAVQDGTGGAQVVRRHTTIPVLEVWNARPRVSPTPPPPAPPWRWLYAGTLDRLKGADRMVWLVRRIQEMGVPLEFWVAGEGPLAHIFAGLPGVRYLGVQSWSRMQTIYPQVHGVLVLNRYANLTLPLVEALAHGRPVVGLEEAGESRVIGEKEGVLWTASLEALVSRLRDLTRPEAYGKLQTCTAAGARRFPFWEEVAAREVAWIQDRLKGP